LHSTFSQGGERISEQQLIELFAATNSFSDNYNEDNVKLAYASVKVGKIAGLNLDRFKVCA
jgi:hypothetical protein